MSDQPSSPDEGRAPLPETTAQTSAPMRPAVSEAASRRRFLIISLSRLVGIGLVMLGLLFDNNVLIGPEWLKFALLAAGVMVIFITPRYLARKWRSPRP